MFLAQAIGSSWIDNLRYDRAAFAELALWRVWTGHFVHLGWLHLLMNAAGLWLIALIFRPELNLRAWLLLFLVTPVLISFGLYFVEPDLRWYVGLSGVLHAAFAMALVLGMSRQPRYMLLVGAAFVAKLLYEVYSPAGNIGTAELIGGRVITTAHWLGALAGLVVALVLLGFEQFANCDGSEAAS